MSEKMELLPCPFCGAEAVHGEVGDECSPDFGGHFIQCTDGRCGASTNLRFAGGDDPRPLLAEQWNRRASSPAAGDVERALRLGLVEIRNMLNERESRFDDEPDMIGTIWSHIDLVLSEPLTAHPAVPSPAAGRDGDWAEVFDAQKSVIEFLQETLLTIKRDNQQYNFGSKLVRIVDGALNRIPALKETPNGN